MIRLLKKMFGIYSGEGKRAFHFALLAFIWSFGISIAETLSISLLVEKIGPNMIPLTNVFTAIGMIAVSCLFILLLRKYPPYKILIGVTFSATVFYGCTFPLLLTAVGPWFWILLQMMTYMFVAALIACYWSFVDEHHDLQDAKRAYGIYNGAYFLGNIAAGIGVNQLIGRIGAHGLFLMTVVILVVSLIHTQVFAPNLQEIEEDEEATPISNRKKIISFFQVLFKSPFVLSLIGMSLFVQLMRTTTEYSYMQSLSKFFNIANSTVAHPITENSLPQFLGKCHAWISLGNIIFGMFFYRKFVRRIGLSNIIMIPPLFFFGLYGEWILQNSLWITVTAILAVEFVLFTIEDNNFNLLIGAAPNKIRGALRIINDSFFEPIGMLLSSLLLIFIQQRYHWMGLGLAGAFLLAAYLVRKNYPKSILNNLRENAVRFDKSMPEWISSLEKKERGTIKKDLFHALENEKNTPIRMMAWTTLLDFHDSSLLENFLLPQLGSFSTKDKLQILSILEDHSFAKHPQVLALVNSWITYTQHPSLSTKAKFYLAKLGLLDPEKVALELESPDLVKKATAIMALKKQSLHLNNSLPEAAQEQTLAWDETEKLLQSDKIEEIFMGLEITQRGTSQDFSPILLSLLENDSLVIQRKAAKTLSAISDLSLTGYAPLLISYLKQSSDQKIRLDILETLGNIEQISFVKDILLASTHFRPVEKRKVKTIITSMGDETIPILLSVIKDPTINNGCRILACKILGKVSPTELKTHLDEVVEREVAQSYFYAFHAHNIDKQYSLESLTYVQKALETGYESTIHFIIHLLVAGGSFEDSDMLVHSLKSKNPKVQAHAVETLEKYCSPKLFRKIFPLIEDSPKEEKLEMCLEAYGPQPKLSLPQLLNRLLHSPSLFEKTIALQLKAKLRMPGWQDSIKTQLDSSDENIHHLVYQLLENG